MSDGISTATLLIAQAGASIWSGVIILLVVIGIIPLYFGSLWLLHRQQNRKKIGDNIKSEACNPVPNRKILKIPYLGLISLREG